MKSCREIALLFLIFSSLALGSYTSAQAPEDTGCSPQFPDLTSQSTNIFNAEQEKYLGEALVQLLESGADAVTTTQDQEMTRIGNRLLAGLPSSGFPYHFYIYESGEINGFSIAGGNVYISRKLIAAVKNEDELAGVIAHEIGHIATHQTAIEVSRALRLRLGVKEVSDRADIFAKIHQMLGTPPVRSEITFDNGKDQLVADRLGLYLMVRAGYSAASYPAFYDKVSENKGKTSNWLSDLFGYSSRTSKRYRADLQLVSELPPGCRARTSTASPKFLAWQHSTATERLKTSAEQIAGDKTVKLDPPLRPILWRVRFSPDGKYILAQDEGGISVVQRDPLKVLFHIDAPGANAGQFTPDSKQVLFNYPTLRVERWNIATGKRVYVRELVVFGGCDQTLLSPDGRTMACANVSVGGYGPRIGLRIVDVASGKFIFNKENFFEPGSMSGMYEQALIAFRDYLDLNPTTMLVSPDAKYMLIAAGRSVLAIDLVSRKPIALEGKLRGLTQGPMSFLGSDKLFVVGDPKGGGLYTGQVFTFPQGQPGKQAVIGPQELNSVAKGDLLIVSPLKDYAVALMDPQKGLLMRRSKFPAIDAWGDQVVMEDGRGRLALGKLDAEATVYLPLPLGELPGPRAAALSRDGRYLAVSLKSRAGFWDMKTGKRLLVVRPFSSVWLDDQDHAFLTCPKYMAREPQKMEVLMPPTDGKLLGKPEKGSWQYRNLMLSLKPMGRGKNTDHHVTLNVTDMRTETLKWSRDFPDESPAFWSAEGNRLVLAWDLNSHAARNEIKKFANLEHEKDALPDKKRGLLLETVVPDSGHPMRQVVVPEADVSGGYDDSRYATVSGNFVLVHGEHNNTGIYRMEDGSKVAEFFGSAVATDEASELVAALFGEDEIRLVAAPSGKQVARYAFASPVRMVRFVHDYGTMLIVLTADQTLHRIPVHTTGKDSAAASSSAR